MESCLSIDEASSTDNLLVRRSQYLAQCIRGTILACGGCQWTAVLVIQIFSNYNFTAYIAVKEQSD